MKYTSIFGVLALAAFIVIQPSPAAALSCMDPAMMSDMIATNDEYVVVTATPTALQEHIREAAVADDPNRQYPSGYTAQLLTVSAVHKGAAADTQWAYFSRNGTWNYLCAGAPPALNKEYVYVLHESYDQFGFTTVVVTHERTSDSAKALLKSIADATTADTGEPTRIETDNAYWVDYLYTQLKEMAFIIEVKLREWRWWLARTI